MYSFGRKHPYNPVAGGFVREGIHCGTFRRFAETNAVVLRLSIPEEAFEALGRQVALMYRRRQYHSSRRRRGVKTAERRNVCRYQADRSTAYNGKSYYVSLLRLFRLPADPLYFFHGGECEWGRRIPHSEKICRHAHTYRSDRLGVPGGARQKKPYDR